MGHKPNCKIFKNSKNKKGNYCDTELGFLGYETKNTIPKRAY